jgi:hypothetical protein
MAGLGVALTTVLASAEQVTCVPSEVLYGKEWGGQIMIDCDGVGYWNFVNRGGCASNDKESIKVWVSQAEAAILSGKRLTIDYDFNSTCNNNIINYLKLLR